MTPLRQRFIDDLRLKNFSDSTIKVYVHAVEKFARFLGRSPDESTAADVRKFLIHELDRGLSADGSRWIHGKRSKRRKPFFAPGSSTPNVPSLHRLAC